MDSYTHASEQISLFCRLNMNAKRELPIRSGEMGMLIYLCTAEGEKTPMGVARFFKVTKAMATNMVTSLSRKGYVEKMPVPDDRRSSLLCPTEKARLLVASAYDEYYKTMSLMQSKMETGEFDLLVSLLEKANHILLEEKQNG